MARMMLRFEVVAGRRRSRRLRSAIGIEEQAVDREVAALGVVLGGGERDAVGVAAVAVGGVGAEGGDFDLAGRRAGRAR